MLQSLLTDRFGLKVSQGQKTIPVYALVITKSAPKFVPAAANDGQYNLSVHDSHMVATSVSMDGFAKYLTRLLEAEDREVVKPTGLIGNYDLNLDWTRDRGNGVPSDATYPGLFTALRERLGLELKSTRASVEVVIVKSANKPQFD